MLVLYPISDNMNIVLPKDKEGIVCAFFVFTILLKSRHSQRIVLNTNRQKEKDPLPCKKYGTLNLYHHVQNYFFHTIYYRRIRT